MLLPPKKTTLTESFCELCKNVGVGIGWVNDVRIQREVISYITNECGFDLMKFVVPKNKDYPIKLILEQARVKFIPMMGNTKTICL